MKGRVIFWIKAPHQSHQHQPHGVVRFKLFGQKCQKCKPDSFEHAMWYPQEAVKVVWFRNPSSVSDMYLSFNWTIFPVSYHIFYCPSFCPSDLGMWKFLYSLCSLVSILPHNWHITEFRVLSVLSYYICRWSTTCMSEWVSCSTVSRPPTTAHNDVRASRASLTNPSYARRVPITFAERRTWKPTLAARRPRQPARPLNPPTRYVTCRQIGPMDCESVHGHSEK